MTFVPHFSANTICRSALLCLLLWLPASELLSAQASLIKPAPATPTLVAPRDVDYPGVMRVAVDATDLDRHIFDVRQSIPVAQAGPMTLLYPKWLPGVHSPLRNTVHLMAGLTITANGQPVPWVRDEIEMTAFHVEVPEGARSLDLHFQYLSPTHEKIGRVVMTPVMLNLQWLSTAFYPAGYFVSRIQVEPSVKLPDGWGFGCALETNSFSRGWVTFKPTTIETLMDSPMFAREADGRAMVALEDRRMRSEHGLTDVVRPGIGFLTFAAVERAFRSLGLTGRFFRSRGPMAWRARRQLAWLRLGRAPAAFGVWVAQ